MGIRPGSRTYVRGAPPARLDDLGHHGLDVRTTLRGSFDYLHLFTTSAAELERELPRMACHLADPGALWVSWPKRRQLGSDLSLPQVIEIGYRHGMVESTTIGLDDTWSAIKFTRPKPGKAYRNSYGRLPDQS